MRTRFLITIFCIPTLLLSQNLSEENLKPNENSTVWEKILYEKVPSDLNIASSLYQIARYQQENPEDAIRKLKEETGILTDKTDKLNIEFFHDDENYKMNVDEINSLTNSTNSQVWNNWAEAYIDITQIFSIGYNLPKGFNMVPVLQPNEDNEGAALQNDSAYIANGADGSGIRIAIFDGGFNGLNTRIANGVAPNAAYYWDNSATTLTSIVSASTSVHGTGCVETVFDNAPGATYEVYRRNSITDYGNAVNQAIANGVDIISNSQSNYNQGWADNTGPVCAAAQNASNNGILWFASAGNRAQSHWEGSFSDTDGDGWHEFSGSDETNDVTISAGSASNFYLSWNNSGTGSSANYDFYLYNIGTTPFTVLASGTSSSGFESFGYTNTGSSAISAALCVRSISGSTPNFEFFRHASNSFEYQTASGSNSSPSNSTAANVISVGALPLNSYNSSPGASGIIASYSSQGPTNSGNLCPDISAPTNTTTQAYGGAFGGTSCATPNAAGAAAAFWSAHPNLSATGVRDILFRKADLYKDWGSNGSDNIYGWGGLYLYDYFANTTYLYRGSNNTAGTATFPYYYIADAENATNSGGRVIMLGGSYTENITLGNNSKNILYKSLIQNSTLGN
jgi:hypothetical protein